MSESDAESREGRGADGAGRRRAAAAAVIFALLVLATLGGIAWWQRGRFLCRGADPAQCHTCCREAGFRISGHGGGEPCECFEVVDLVDERGTIRLGSGGEGP